MMDRSVKSALKYFLRLPENEGRWAEDGTKQSGLEKRCKIICFNNLDGKEVIGW